MGDSSSYKIIQLANLQNQIHRTIAQHNTTPHHTIPHNATTAVKKNSPVFFLPKHCTLGTEAMVVKWPWSVVERNADVLEIRRCRLWRESLRAVGLRLVPFLPAGGGS